MDQTPSRVTARLRQKRRLPETGILQFDTEIAAPDSRLRTPTGTGASSSTKSANGSRASRRMEFWEGRKAYCASRWSGVAMEVARPKPF